MSVEPTHPFELDLVVATAALLSTVLSSRATYIHIGALFGTIFRNYK